MTVIAPSTTYSQVQPKKTYEDYLNAAAPDYANSDFRLKQAARYLNYFSSSNKNDDLLKEEFFLIPHFCNTEIESIRHQKYLEVLWKSRSPLEKIIVMITEAIFSVLPSTRRGGRILCAVSLISTTGILLYALKKESFFVNLSKK